MAGKKFYSTQEVARIIGKPGYLVNRVFTYGMVEETPRLGIARLIPEEMIPTIRVMAACLGGRSGRKLGLKKKRPGIAPTEELAPVPEP